jgi:hypothetical protein
MAVTINGTSGITTPGLTNSGSETLTGTATFGSTISVGGVTPAASGAGVTFPATQSSSSDANTLDDYEEGTWTPILATDSTGASITYTAQIGKYTKVGNVVNIEGEVTWSARSGGSGNVTVGGLPFNVTDSATYGVRIPLSYASGVSTAACLGFFQAPVGVGSLYLYPLASNTPYASTSITGAGGVAFKGFYYA